MNPMIVYAKNGNERILIGAFDSLENIYEEVEEKLDYLNLSAFKSPSSLIYVCTGSHEYRMIWGQNSPQMTVEKSTEVDY